MCLLVCRQRGLEWFHSEPLLHFLNQIDLRKQAGLLLPFQDGFPKYSLSPRNSIFIINRLFTFKFRKSVD